MASLIDTNILIYRFDTRDMVKHELASETIKSGLAADAVVIPHQAIVEFIAATTRPRADLGGVSLISIERALQEADILVNVYPVLYPNRAVVRTALSGVTTFGLSWFDAHLWAYAEVNGIPEILSEDFEHGRYYGGVRIRNPFLTGVHELPQQYAT